MNNNNFSIRVKELRFSKNLSQKSLGEAVGLSMQTINDIENGRRTTTMEKLVSLADFFDVTLDYLVGRSDDKKTSKGNTDSQSREEELINNYRSLDDVSKGKLIERSRVLLDESVIRFSKKQNA